MKNVPAPNSSYTRHDPPEISFASLVFFQSRFSPRLEFAPKPSSHGWLVPCPLLIPQTTKRNEGGRKSSGTR
jgi:hypothetical protein